MFGAIISGAGALAGAVGNLFDGTAKANRQERRAERKERREERRELRQQDTATALADRYAGKLGTGAGMEAGSADNVTTPIRNPMPEPEKADFMELVKKYWWIGLILLVLFGGGKFLKPKRTYRRRSTAKPKVVYRTRYRSRSPSPRRR